MITPKHTPGPWQVLPDPDLKGLHPYHDNRWITTAGAHWEENFDGYQGGRAGWTLEEGSAICTLRDTQAQAADAALIAAAPALLRAARRALPWIGKMIADGGHLAAVAPNDALGAMEELTAAIDQAEPEPKL